MGITRRDFLKYCIGSATALGLSSTIVGTLTKALAGDSNMPTVIWIEGSSCSGCTVSLTNLIGSSSSGGPVDIADLLINNINTVFAKTVMSACGDLSVSNLRTAQQAGGYVLVVEGGIPTAFNGMACTVWSENGNDITMMQAVQELAPGAAAVLCVGSCSSFGGIPSAGPNPTKVKSVKELTGISTINMPGCPAHPDWVAGTIASLLCGNIPATDSAGRPLAFYGNTVHSKCPKKPLYELGTNIPERAEDCFAARFGEEGKCLNRLGCNGPDSHADCPSRGWNNGMNYCTQANANCIGCVEPDFPKSPLIARPA